jgi:hypothetical protein
METKTINQIWKSQDLVSEIDYARIKTLRGTADELTLLRNRFMKRQLFAPVVIIYFLHLAYTAFMKYLSTGDWTNLCSVTVMLFFIVLSIGQLYLLYRWRQAEIFADTRGYLTLSRKILLGHMKVSRNSHYIFLPVIVIMLITVYAKVQLILFIVIVACFITGFAIVYSLQRGFIDKLALQYKPIMDGIDAVLKNINEPE